MCTNNQKENIEKYIYQLYLDYQIYKTIDKNYESLMYTINEYNSNVNFKTALEIKERIFELNRKLTNFILSTRFFLDIFKSNLNFRKETELLTNFKETCDNQYKSNSSYRLGYYLRNYATHIGLPLNEVSFEWNCETGQKTNLILNKSVFLKKFDFSRIKNPEKNKKFKEDVKKLNDKHDILYTIKEYKECLKYIFYNYLKKSEKKINKNFDCIDKDKKKYNSQTIEIREYLKKIIEDSLKSYEIISK
jgi:hypothetical protein